MSRIAKNSIKVPKEVTCNYENNLLSVKGKLGEMSLAINSLFTINIKEIRVDTENFTKSLKKRYIDIDIT